MWELLRTSWKTYMAIITLTTTLRGFQQAARSINCLSQSFRRMGQRVFALVAKVP